LALGLDPAPGPHLRDTLDALRAQPELAVPPPENLHVTLVFLGEIDRTQADAAGAAVVDAVSGMRPWTVAWGTVGAFPSRTRPRVLWLGLQDETATRAVQAVLSVALSRRGIALEERVFRPHLTLARVRRSHSGPLPAGLEAQLEPLLLPPPARVGAIVLYQSVATGGSPVYQPLLSVSL